MLTVHANKKVKAFVALSSVPYRSMPSSDEHEAEHNYGHKKAWGRAGVAALKALAIETAGIGTFHHNPSGSIDRGYVSGFVSNVEGTKHVYVHFSDAMNDCYFRTAESTKDYTGGQNNFARLTPDEIGRAHV